jgi:DNA-binding GntR family transcriptional regulator
MNKKDEVIRSRGEIAYEQLFSAIQNGILKPGTRVRESDIAEQFGISRTPVRDAIHRLESDGLIVHLPRQGAIIKTLNHHEIIEMYEFREILEGTAAQYATKHASELEIKELEELNELMFESDGDYVKVAQANRLFHQTLYNAANNRYLIDALNNLSNAMALLGGTTLQMENRTLNAYEEHKKIIEYIKSNQALKADQSIRQHIQNAQHLRIKMNRGI